MMCLETIVHRKGNEPVCTGTSDAVPDLKRRFAKRDGKADVGSTRG